MAERRKLNLEVVVISRDIEAAIEILIGNLDLSTSLCKRPYDTAILDFLNYLSSRILRNKSSKSHPDLITFAFWCRKANLNRLKKDFNSTHLRIGRGVVFHIVPSNVATNALYSLVFGLLAGNKNLVRFPTKKWDQHDLFIRVLAEVLDEEKYSWALDYICILRYETSREISSAFSYSCDARIMWGGDNTIAEMSSMDTLFHNVDVVFPDRQSICLIDASHLVELGSLQMDQVYTDFFNDTLLMDQNACSSPYLIFWFNVKNADVKREFWEGFAEFLSKEYWLDASAAYLKYELMVDTAITNDIEMSFTTYSHLLTVCDLEKIPDSNHNIKGRYGLFFQVEVSDLTDVFPALHRKIQTATTLGFDDDVVAERLVSGGARGIDRVVSVGNALDMSVLWDGMDIVEQLSRIVHTR